MTKDKDVIQKYCERVGYNPEEAKLFLEGGHRTRQVKRLAEAAPRFSIEAKVIGAKNCNTGYKVGDRFILDVDGNFVNKFCPKRMCVYLVSQLVVPVALINERLSEGLDPNGFHFMRYVRCLDTGVECMGYGEVTICVKVIKRAELA
jgi:uncharacterized repeat protein (TIGR04076 family)